MFEKYREKITQRFKGKKDVFPGQIEGEKVLFFTRRHPLSFLGMVAIAIGMLVLPIAGFFIFGIAGLAISSFGTKLIFAIFGAYILFVMGFFLVAWINYYYDVVIITDNRVVEISQEALFTRRVAEANLVDVEDVNAEVKGILNTLFHFGTVNVQTAGAAENFEFLSLPNPYRISKMISDLHQKTVEESERQEAKEIGRSIIGTKAADEVTQKDVDSAAQRLAHHGKIHAESGVESDKTSPETAPEKDKNQGNGDNAFKNYQESSGWEDMDQRPRSDQAKRPGNEEKNNPSGDQGKNDRFIDHDDLEKGGGEEF
jgi:hypothetical protein